MTSSEKDELYVYLLPEPHKERHDANWQDANTFYEQWKPELKSTTGGFGYEEGQLVGPKQVCIVHTVSHLATSAAASGVVPPPAHHRAARPLIWVVEAMGVSVFTGVSVMDAANWRCVPAPPGLEPIKLTFWAKYTSRCKGSGEGEFSRTGGSDTIMAREEVFICDVNNHRVQVRFFIFFSAPTREHRLCDVAPYPPPTRPYPTPLTPPPTPPPPPETPL